ncbi:MAG: hypothetical protein ACPG05_02525 [Bdellovibrionales bacterium]
MHKNIYNTHNRYKNRNRVQMRRFFLNTVFVIALFFFGLWLGKSHSGGQVEFLEQQAQERADEIRTLQEELTLSRANAQTAEARYKQLQDDVLEELPFDGPLRNLIEELRARLEEGVNPERLTFAIKAARPPQNCTDAQVRRFVVSTPAYKGPDSTVEIENAISVSGSGASSQNEQGQPEAWYNAAKPVTITFKANTGETQTKKGALPFSDTMIVGDKEYRFTLSEGARSFIKVTYDRCDYP